MTITVTDLGFLAGGSFSRALNCSHNGHVVVGTAANVTTTLPVYWDATNLIHALPLPAGTSGGAVAQASACATDATVIVGHTGDDGIHASVPARWVGTPGVGYIGAALELVHGGIGPYDAGVVYGCSADAALICGAVISGDPTPCVWANLALALLPLPVGMTRGIAYGFSSDGTKIVGYADNGVATGHAVSWSGGPVWVATVLGAVAGTPPDFIPQAYACSSNGGIVVGQATNPAEDVLATFWNPTSPNFLAAPQGGAGSSAQGCDGSGVYVSGTSAASAACLWISNVGQNLPLFAGAVSVDFAPGMSGDASTAVGSGINALSQVTAVKWVSSGGAPWPLPVTAVLDMGRVTVTSLATESPCTVAQYTTPPSVSPAVGLRWSDTRGQTFGNPVAQELSDDPLSQLQWNRTGYARGRVFELFWSAASQTALNGAFIEIDPWKS